MGKFKHFELSEFIESNEAKRRGINNTPTFEIIDHLEELITKILEPLREAYGKPLTISSGYRCPKLNQAVGGVATSAHKVGYAADIKVKDIDGLFNFVTEWVKAKGIMFDQIFIETKGSSKWLHVGFKNQNGLQRRMISRLNIPGVI